MGACEHKINVKVGRREGRREGVKFTDEDDKTDILERGLEK